MRISHVIKYMFTVAIAGNRLRQGLRTEMEFFPLPSPQPAPPSRITQRQLASSMSICSTTAETAGRRANIPVHHMEARQTCPATVLGIFSCGKLTNPQVPYTSERGCWMLALGFAAAVRGGSTAPLLHCRARVRHPSVILIWLHS
eukprot:SAG31_NODE_4451_length_3220_cov_5.866709_1_plen_145_part_00